MSADPIVAADAFGTLGSIWLKQRDFARARECYARSAELGDQNVRPWALKNLALTERELGHWDAAVADFNRVIETKHSDYSPSAMMLLGATYELNLNDLVAARREYERAIESGHPDYGPRSAYLCALVIRRLGDNAAAVKTLQRAATSGHKDHGPSAKYLLARWYGLDWNDPVTGRRLLEEVVATGHSEWAPKAKELLSKRPFAGVIVRQ
jgi:tetratricopeptide (TPR) repeat protein